MTTATTDSKKRVVIPAAKPGEVFDVQREGEGRFLLVRLARPEPLPRMSRRDSLRAMAAMPLRQRMSWSELRRLTRDP